jgi:hypothetical protein
MRQRSKQRHFFSVFSVVVLLALACLLSGVEDPAQFMNSIIARLLNYFSGIGNSLARLAPRGAQRSSTV